MKFIREIVNYCKANPLMAGVTAAAAVFAVILLVIVIVLSSKAKKAAKAQAQTQEQETAQAPVSVQPEPQEESVQTAEPVQEEAQSEPVQEEAQSEPVQEEVEPVEEEKQPEPVQEEAEPVEEAVEEEIEPKTTEKEVINESMTENEEVKTELTQEEVKPAPRKKALVEEIDEAGEVMDFYEEDETDKQARYRGKWVICRVVTDDEDDGEEMYFFELRASNGEKLLSSEEYASYTGALRGIETHKANILRGNFKITLSKKGDYIFKLLSGKNLLLCMGENYPTRARCESAIESAKRFAETAVIDENVQDHVIKAPADDNTPITPLAEGCIGKWIIDTAVGADGEQVFFFELYANNGEKLLSSEEYTTYIGAVNGIQTHKKNIDKGNFRISLTKRGDYIYKLLNANGQLLCLGEHYKSKRLCQNAVESVKRFAMNSPVLTDISNKQ